MADTLTQDFPNVQVTHVYDKGLPGFAAKMTVEDAAAMAHSDMVDYIEQDGKVKAYVDSWGLDRIDQRDMPLDYTFSPFADGSGVHAYIIDTGIRTTHSDFGGRAIWGTNTSGDGINADCDGHGTHVAGTVGGTNYGVAKAVTLVAVKVLDCDGYGSYAGVINGVNWVAGHANGKKATANLSLGGPVSEALNTAVNNLHQGGVPTVVAAGNDMDDACLYSPASADKALTIGSTDDWDWTSWFSNQGKCVDMFAPGSSITAP